MTKKTNSEIPPIIKEAVNSPAHYGGKDNPLEVIKIIDHYGLSFSLGNTIKYILRKGKKDPNKEIEDLQKGMWYLNHEIEKLKKEQEELAYSKLREAIAVGKIIVKLNKLPANKVLHPPKKKAKKSVIKKVNK